MDYCLSLLYEVVFVLAILCLTPVTDTLFYVVFMALSLCSLVLPLYSSVLVPFRVAVPHFFILALYFLS